MDNEEENISMYGDCGGVLVGFFTLNGNTLTLNGAGTVKVQATARRRCERSGKRRFGIDVIKQQVGNFRCGSRSLTEI